MTLIAFLVTAILLLVAGCSGIERKLLFFPTHHQGATDLAPWMKDGEVIGYAREVDAPQNVWLMLHGNAGQASDRSYALPSFSSDDAVYIMEYPGYGQRQGKPTRNSFNDAAEKAYLQLRREHPGQPICVVGESIGSGPSSFLATLTPPPDKIVLIAPFDKLSRVAKHHLPSLLVRLLLKDNWDNVEALSHYFGPVDIFAGEADTIIPMSHAQALADAIPSSQLIIFEGGHNDWSQLEQVRIRNP